MAYGMDLKILENFLKKINIEEKSLLNTNHARIPELFIKLWYMNNNPLVLDVPKITNYWGENAMKRFLKHVKLDKMEYLIFSLEHIKDIFYILEKPILTLWDCKILPTCGDLGRIQEWELLTIPELIPNLLKLTLQIDVNLNFVVQFKKLSCLTLYKNISSHNLHEILTYCRLLRQLNLVNDNLCMSLNDKLLTEITGMTLSVNMFKQNTTEVLKLQNITTFSITHCDKKFTTEWVKCVNYYISHVQREISLMILSGKDNPKFELNDINFSDIEHIMLADFPALDNETVIKMFNKHPKIRFLMFKNCPNLTVPMIVEIDNILERLLLTDFSIYFENCPKIEATLLKVPYESERLTIEEEVDLPTTYYQNFMHGMNIAEFHYIEEEPTTSSAIED